VATLLVIMIVGVISCERGPVPVSERGPPTWNLKMSLSFRLVTAGPLAIWILGRYEFIVSTMNS
jgi:hypothetical protein